MNEGASTLGANPERDLRSLDALDRDELIALLRRQLEEGVRISFSGKDKARRIYRRVQPRTSRVINRYSVGDPESQARNLLLEGENLQGMATLYRERGQVDLILADPPYNTGEDFRYNDKWDEDPNDPELGDLVAADDLSRHTKWMRFMWPRLQLMIDMLKPSGVLAICIDHRELFHLGQMLDEFFGEKNRLAIINWQKSYSPRSDNNHVSTATEYVLVYAKDEKLARTALLTRTEAQKSRYANLDGDPDGDWREHDLSAATFSFNAHYGIQSPLTGKIYYPTGRRAWAHPKRDIQKWLQLWGVEYEERVLHTDQPKALMVRGGTAPSAGRGRPARVHVFDGAIPTSAREAAERLQRQQPWPFIWFGVTGTGGPRVKRYLDRVKKGIVPMTYWADEDYEEPLLLGCTSWDDDQSGSSQTGIKELKAVVGPAHGFETVKPLALFMKIIQLWCPPSGLVLDPFAGSGTTGHAVLELNAQTESNRRFILIEQGRPDKGDTYARALTAERLKRVITGKWMNGKGRPLGNGFRFSQLQKTVDARALLGLERDEMTDAVIASHYDVSRRTGSSLITMTHDDDYKYLVARNTENEGFYLVWDGSAAGDAPVFDDDAYDHVVQEAVKAGLKPIYHVYARFNLYQSNDVRFYQIPDRILMDFGLSAANDSFNHLEEA